MNMSEKIMNLSKKTKLIICGVVVVIVLIAAVIAALLVWRNYQAEGELECLQMAVVQENVGELIEFPEVELPDPIPPLAERYEDFPEIDFDEQWDVNEDVCAWIRIPDTHVDYPILRRGDSDNRYDSYYLNTTIDGVEGLPGSIYIEPCNSPEFTDFNTVIYGHNMRNKTMFGDLHGYDDETFFQEHPYVYVVTPDKNLVYQVASAVYFDDRHIMYSFDFEDPARREDYLGLLTGNSDSRNKYQEDITLTTEDRLITLSTCVGGESNRRFFITAVLLEEQEEDRTVFVRE